MGVSVSIADLAKGLQAEILCCSELTGKMVENVMIGAMTYGSGEDYFARKDNKAVITRGERPDMALAALGTSTACLIISNGNEASPQVINWAEDKGVPVLAVKQGVIAVADEIDNIFGKTVSGQQETQKPEQAA